MSVETGTVNTFTPQRERSFKSHLLCLITREKQNLFLIGWRALSRQFYLPTRMTTESDATKKTELLLSFCNGNWLQSVRSKRRICSMAEADVTLARLEDQINWYDRKSLRSQKVYKSLKLVEIAAAALIPLFSGFRISWVAGSLGALVALVEGILHLNQYHENWINYRSTCESLTHEKYLYLAMAGPYAAPGDAHRLLAERIESLVSQEHAKWAAVHEQTEQAHH